MALPTYRSISVIAYSPIHGVRCEVLTNQFILGDVDSRGPLFSKTSNQIQLLTGLEDVEGRLIFGLRAVDTAPTDKVKDLVPLMWMVLHYVRDRPEWETLPQGQVLNIVVLDWPHNGIYGLSTWLICSDSPLSQKDMPGFYNRIRAQSLPEVQRLMPTIHEEPQIVEKQSEVILQSPALQP